MLLYPASAIVAIWLVCGKERTLLYIPFEVQSWQSAYAQEFRIHLDSAAITLWFLMTSVRKEAFYGSLFFFFFQSSLMNSRLFWTVWLGRLLFLKTNSISCLPYVMESLQNPPCWSFLFIYFLLFFFSLLIRAVSSRNA